MLRRFITVAIGFLLVACGGGGDTVSKLSNSACSDLGLPTLVPKIINGTACDSLEDSPVVRVVSVNRRRQITAFCTGTMITSQDVLTAAHCFDLEPAGAYITYGPQSSAIAVDAATVYVHPGYKKIGTSNAETTFNDVAVVHLSRGVSLPSMPVLGSRAPRKKEVVSVFGYGSDENGIFDGINLKGGQMRIDSVTDNHILAIYAGEGSNTCQGDSGGPLIVKVKGVPAIAGVTATGTQEGCGAGDRSWFTNVHFKDVLDFLTSVAPGTGRV